MDLFEKLSVKGKSTIAFLPIKPVYANRLLSGEKLFEYRRASIKENLSHIVIYASSPMKKIIGVAKVASIHKDSLTATWEKTKHASGISYKLYKEYFDGAKYAYALEIEKVYPFITPVVPSEVQEGFKIPQSFKYIDTVFLNNIYQKGICRSIDSGRLIFVAGIHGVGKSTFCRKISKITGWDHLIASRLIKKMISSKLKKLLSSQKTVSNIQANQDLMIYALQNELVTGKDYLFDGHFTLFDSRKQIQKLPVSTFRQLNPSKILLVVDNPQSIQGRLRKRDNHEYDKKVLKKMQDAEMAHAAFVGKTLGIEVQHIHLNDSKQFLSLIKKNGLN